MVRLGIRAIFLKHQYVPERRDAGTNTDEHRPHHVALVKPLAISTIDWAHHNPIE